MKRNICLLSLMLLALAALSPEASAASAKGAKGSQAVVEKRMVPSESGELQRYDFFRNKKKIASQLLNPNADVMKQEGSIPDGVGR